MKKPLSYSGYSRYMMCPKMYQFHDIDKDRPESGTTALAVGSIVDEVVMGMLEGKKIDHIPLIHKYAQERLKFYTHDLDLDLIDLGGLKEIASDMRLKPKTLEKDLKTWIKSPEKLNKDQYRLLHAAAWESLSVKIAAMLDSFEAWILPQIVEVHQVQADKAANGMIGKLDFIATVKDGRRVLFDLKTSSKPYKPDAVRMSPQLSLYASLFDEKYAGYIILCKSLNKQKVKSCPDCGYGETGGNRLNCPDCKTRMDITQTPKSYSQILIDEVPQHDKDLTTEALNDTIKGIKAGHFPRNLNNCGFMYGNPCPYVNKCWKLNEGE